MEPLFFHGTATAKVFPNNTLDEDTQEFALKDMKDTGKLENSWFYTVIDSSSSESSAISSSNIYAFDKYSSEFAQTSIFTNANRTYDWFISMGYANFGLNPIRLVVHAIIGGDSNNALYQPASEGSSTIFVGDGDGIILKNLSTDADVVSHEFGHHVIYSTLTSVRGESLVLHEGIADFFTFARTGNACLGESICPTDSQINCAINEKCLRTAENEYKLGDSNLPVEPHLRSQFISGLMWDLQTKDNINVTDLTKIVLGAIELLAQESGYHDLILALLKADKNIAAGANCNTIYNRAIARGLENKMEDIQCGTDFPNIKSPEIATPEVEATKSGGSSLCGVTGKESTTPISLLFILPLGIPLLSLKYQKKWVLI